MVHLQKTKKNWKVYANWQYKFYFKNEFDKVYFQHNIVYDKTKDLAKRTQSDKFLKEKAFKIASNPKYGGYQRELAWTVYKFLDKKSASLNKSSGSGIVNEPNYQLASELHTPIVRKF